MNTPNDRLNNLISRLTSGMAIPIPVNESWNDAIQRLDHRSAPPVKSEVQRCQYPGRVIEINEEMYNNFRYEFGCIPLDNNHPGIGFWFAYKEGDAAAIFWQHEMKFFGRQLSDGEDEDLRVAAGLSWCQWWG